MRNEPQAVRLMMANLVLRHRNARALVARARAQKLPDAIINARIAVEIETRNTLMTTRIALDTGELVYPLGAGFELAKRLGEQRERRAKA